MTEFALGPDVVLGLMPGAGIARLLGVSDPAESERVPKAELYLRVDRIDEYHARALAAGARELNPPAVRDWGDTVAYSHDPDGYILAFAQAAGRQPDP